MSSTSQDDPVSNFLFHLGLSFIHSLIEVSTFTLFYGGFELPEQKTNKLGSVLDVLDKQHIIFTGHSPGGHAACILWDTHAFSPHWIQNIPVLDRDVLINQLLFKPNVVAIWLLYTQIIISDGVIIWRVVTLMQHRKLAIASLSLLMLGSTDVTSTTKSSNMALKVAKNGALEYSGLGLSLATNTVATATFGYVYWVHKRDMIIGLGRHQPTQAERALVLLVESGVGYCLVQAVFFIAGFFGSLVGPKNSNAITYAHLVLLPLFDGLSAIYPTAVIALVNSHRTLGHMHSVDSPLPLASSTLDSNVTASLEFAVPNPVIRVASRQVENGSEGQVFNDGNEH
ncbi:hypothetical protein BDZ94DRAFT_1305576 [Collybia nuda]|uniref:Uncharacterized protein n=1 Tax=Collybia nuda TaxID=64659 RepID=A0A9P5YD50_9AGAR|nr:hypothetical protein BDZ94DRAFT_1305576 [Collybia nuda]